MTVVRLPEGTRRSRPVVCDSGEFLCFVSLRARYHTVVESVRVVTVFCGLIVSFVTVDRVNTNSFYATLTSSATITFRPALRNRRTVYELFGGL